MTNIYFSFGKTITESSVTLWINKEKARWINMGKNKQKGISSDPMKEKTQELEETKRISKVFAKHTPIKPK